MNNIQEQEDEMLALDNILNLDTDQHFSDAKSEDTKKEVKKWKKIFEWQRKSPSSSKSFEFSGQIEAPVHLTRDVEISYHWRSGSSQRQDAFRVSHLPPIQLSFHLPHDYPSVSPPDFRLNCPWLTPNQISKLAEKLRDIFKENENEVILFHWYSFLTEEALAFLELIKEDYGLDLSEIVEVAVEKNVALLRESKKVNEARASSPKSKPNTDFVIIDDDEQVWGQKEEKSRTDKTQASASSSFMAEASSTSHKTWTKKNRLRIEREERIEFEKLLKKEVGKSRSWKDRNKKKGVLDINSNSKESHGQYDLYSGDLKLTEKEMKELDLRFELAKKAHNIVSEKLKKGDIDLSKEIFRGEVQFFNKEYGFIHCRDQPNNVYVSKFNLLGVSFLKSGDLVEFDLGRGNNNKVKALNVIKCDEKKKKKSDSRKSQDETEANNKSSTNNTNNNNNLMLQNGKVLKVDETYRVLVDENGHLVDEETRTKNKPPPVQVQEICKPDEKEEENVFILPEVIGILKDFNEIEKDRRFEASTFPCEICFTEKMGRDCIRFKGCDHVYCQDCIKTYFVVKIQDDAVTSLTCPFNNCDTQALPNQVKSLVPSNLYLRYESKLLETTLNSMSDVLLCPRIHCQSPVLIDRDNSLANCPNPKCGFVFCIYCKATFHGVQPCRIKSKEHRNLVNRYMTAKGEDKILLEKRYGKRQLIAMRDELLSEKYKDENTKSCPLCSAPIQKSDGCNKMVCNKCQTPFCWICGAKLPRNNPYSHFNVLASECYMKLFEGAQALDENEVGDDDEDDDIVWLALALGEEDDDEDEFVDI